MAAPGPTCCSEAELCWLSAESVLLLKIIPGLPSCETGHLMPCTIRSKVKVKRTSTAWQPLERRSISLGLMHSLLRRGRRARGYHNVQAMLRGLRLGPESQVQGTPRFPVEVLRTKKAIALALGGAAFAESVARGVAFKGRPSQAVTGAESIACEERERSG